MIVCVWCVCSEWMCGVWMYVGCVLGGCVYVVNVCVLVTVYVW